MSFGAIYKFVCRDKSIKEFYIGSTNNLKSRIASHKHNCNNIDNPHYILPIYMFINVNGGWDNWDIEVIIKLPNINKDTRRYIEQLYKDVYNPTLNDYNAMGIDKARRKETKKNGRLDDIVKCPICDKDMREDSIQRHIDDVHNKIKSKCPVCDLEMNKNSIPRHIKSKH